MRNGGFCSVRGFELKSRNEVFLISYRIMAVLMNGMLKQGVSFYFVFIGDLFLGGSLSARCVA